MAKEVISPDGRPRCPWALTHPLHLTYHDAEWGVPVREDGRLFEMLILESFQAGLSWLTILQKREGFRAAFAGFDAGAIARFDDARLEALAQDPAIVRNKAKIKAARTNARAYLELRETTSLTNWLWNFVDGRTVRNAWTRQSDVPATTALSDRIAKEFKRLGFAFLGTTTVYAYLQSVGVVNDHLTSCFRWEEVGR